MTIGTAALGLDSRFGLNVVFAHEAYRDGIDNGEEGQRLETNRAVEGHVDTALALMAGYGNASVGFEFMAEAKIFDLARTNNDTATMRKILDRYDSSADYWKVIVKNDGTYKMEDDGSDDITLVDEKGKQLAFFEYQGGSRTGFIAETLGLDKKTVNNLMASSGWTYYTEKGWSSSLSGDAAAIRFGTDLSKQISFPVSAEQLLMFKDIIGTVYEKDGQQNTFNYDGVRISYAPVTEEVLRNEVNKLLKDKSDPAGIARLQKLDPNATLDQIVEGMIGTQIADQKKGDLALSLPNDRIYIPPQQYSTSLLVHEMFHQFQYAMNDNGDGFARLVSDMVTKASGKNSSINSGLPVGYVYDYSHYNTGTVNTLSDITTYEGQADVFFDFAGGYLGGVSNNTRVGHGYTVTKLAQIIYNSGFNSPAARKVLGIP
jgi:hypothetical protein